LRKIQPQGLTIIVRGHAEIRLEDAPFDVSQGLAVDGFDGKLSWLGNADLCELDQRSRIPVIIDLDVLDQGRRPKMLRPTSSSASSSPSSLGRATKPFTSSWPPPSMTRTFASAWSPQYRHSPTTWFGIPSALRRFPRRLACRRTVDSRSLHRHPRRGNSVREKLFRLLQKHDLLSDERIKILRS